MTDPLLAAQGAFPGNVLQVLDDEFKTIPDIELVEKRPLTKFDPSFSIGLIALGWRPGAHEINGRSNHAGQLLGRNEPVLSTYTFAIQAFAKHADAVEGLAIHSLLSKLVRTMLYRGPQVPLRLAALSETSLGVTERLQRWGVGQQRFASNEIESEWVYLSTTEMWVETETSPE